MMRKQGKKEEGMRRGGYAVEGVVGCVDLGLALLEFAYGA